MRLRTLATGTIALLGFCLADSALADSKVTFDIKFSGRVDCYSPIKLDNVPLSVKGTGVLRSDGTARMETTETAYYILSAKSEVEGRLGAPPIPIVGGTGQLKVVSDNGLAMILNYPNTRYTVTATVVGKKCTAELVATTKNKKKIYDIFAVDAQFLCSRFEVEKSSCRVH
jgi:hypothetical protein